MPTAILVTKPKIEQSKKKLPLVQLLLLIRKKDNVFVKKVLLKKQQLLLPAKHVQKMLQLAHLMQLELKQSILVNQLSIN